jgi:hypothetical protein
MFPKVGLIEEIKGGSKEGKNDRANYSGIYHIYVGRRHNETHTEHC